MIFELGETLKEKVTGFQGVVMARAEYLVGSINYGLLSQELQGGVPGKLEWFEENRLSKVSGKIRITLPKRKAPRKGKK